MTEVGRAKQLARRGGTGLYGCHWAVSLARSRNASVTRSTTAVSSCATSKSHTAYDAPSAALQRGVRTSWPTGSSRASRQGSADARAYVRYTSTTAQVDFVRAVSNMYDTYMAARPRD